MSEKNACASVVAAARADEESAVALSARRSSAGDPAAVGSSTVVKHESSHVGADGSSVRQAAVLTTGESLLLPLLVQQLRHSITTPPEGAALRPAPQAPIAPPPSDPGVGPPAVQSPRASHPTADDSGTESGDDLRLLAVGLRDSIELQRSQERERGEASESVSFPLGRGLDGGARGLLGEVQVALARLNASLRGGGELGAAALEPERREALLTLVQRLQASLALPPVAPAPPASAISSLAPTSSTPVVECPPAHSRRFAARRQRQNRHTVDVTREELADARRFLEDLARNNSNASLPAAVGPSANAPAVVPESSANAPAVLADDATLFPVMKQNSAGELRSAELAAPLTPAQKAFRPVKFVPVRSKSTSGVADAIAIEETCAAIESAGKTPSQNQTSENRGDMFGNSQTSNEQQATYKAQSNTACDAKPETTYQIQCELSDALELSDPSKNGTQIVVANIGESPRKSLETVRPKHRNVTQSYESVVTVPIAPTLGREYRPTRLKLSEALSESSNVSLSNGSFVDSSDCSLDARQAPEHVSSLPPVNSNDMMQGVTSNSSSFTANALSSWSQVPTPLTSDSVNIPPASSVPQSSWDGSRRQSESSARSTLNTSRSSCEQLVSKDVNSQPLNASLQSNPSLFSATERRPLGQSKSLDNNGQVTSLCRAGAGNSQHRDIIHSASLDSASSEYDPSVLLFTPSQAMQIAVHKAAINKQLSQEEDTRKRSSEQQNGTRVRQESQGSIEAPSEESIDDDDDEFLSGESRRSDADDEDEQEDEVDTKPTVKQIINADILCPKTPQHPETSNMNCVDGSTIDKKHYVAAGDYDDFFMSETDNINDFNTKSSEFKTIETNNIPDSSRLTNVIQKESTLNKKEVPGVSEVAKREFVCDEIEGNAYINPVNTSDYGRVPLQLNGSMQYPDVEHHIQDQKLNTINQTAPHSAQSMGTLLRHDSSSYKYQIASQNQNSCHQKSATCQMQNEDTDQQNYHQQCTAVSMFQNHNSSPYTQNQDQVALQNNVSSAQRLLQIATTDSKIPSRYRSDKKVKMKRANTIDIPKPLNFYEIEDESDYSNEDAEMDRLEGSPGEHEKHHRSAYLVLRGPIRVAGGKHPGDKVPHPSFQPKTESDRKFLAFLQRHGGCAGDSAVSTEAKKSTASYNPSARGGQHWSNRFSNIKTAFEVNSNSGSVTSTSEGRSGSFSNYGPAASRLFWQSADDSAAFVKTRTSAAANGPKLTRQGSQFLRKLFEQKHQEKQAEHPMKLPWTEKNDENVVVGSLTVSRGGTQPTMPTSSSIYNKKQVFNPPPSPISQPLKINKFSHAPMSAFRPVGKKVIQQPEISAPTPEQPWALPSNSGNVKQLASQKFAPLPSRQSLPSSVEPQIISKTIKQRGSFIPNHHPPEVPSPMSPTLPWIKENTNSKILNSAVAKFENMSRETSPQPTVTNSRTSERIAVPATLSLHKLPTEPPSKTFVPPPVSSGIVQGRIQENNIFPCNVPSLREPPALPKPPALLSPSMSVAQALDSRQTFSKQDYMRPQEILRNHQEKVSKKSTEPETGSMQYYQAPSSGSHMPVQLPPMQNHQKYQTQSLCKLQSDKLSSQPHLQQTENKPKTYSGSVSSRTSVYPSALSTSPNTLEKMDMLETKSPPQLLIPSLKSASPNLESPDILSPEEFTAVSHVMTGPISHQAVTVSQKTRQRYEEEETGGGGRNSAVAARNLSSMLQISMSKSPSPGNEKRASPQKPGMVRNKSEPELQIHDNSQFSEYQPSPQRSIVDAGVSGAMRTGQQPPMSGSMKHRPASAESLILATSKEELHESGESILTTRLQIPVYNNVSSKVSSHRSGSVHDIQGTHCPEENCLSPVRSPISKSIHKSGSWHQLAQAGHAGGVRQNDALVDQSGTRAKRPQSLALPNLPPGPSATSTRRGHATSLTKAKSSHSLAFPKQFEAALAPDSIETKKNKVEAYLSAGKSSQKSLSPRPTQGSVPLLDDSIDNVEEAFENLFNSTSGSSKSVKMVASRVKTKKSQPLEKMKGVGGGKC